MSKIHNANYKSNLSSKLSRKWNTHTTFLSY
jgi:hypothetical protein